MTFWCYNCDILFDESDARARRSELEDGLPPGIMVVACPHCGETTVEEADQCDRCGEPIEPDTHLCKECDRELYKTLDGIVNEFRHDDYFANKDAFLDYIERVWF